MLAQLTIRTVLVLSSIAGIAGCSARQDERSIDERLEVCVETAAGGHIDLAVAARDASLVGAVRSCFTDLGISFDEYLLKLDQAEFLLDQQNTDRLACFEGLGWTPPEDANWANPVIFGAQVPALDRARFADDYMSCMNVEASEAAPLRDLILSATAEDAAFQREMNAADADGHGAPTPTPTPTT